MSSSSDNKWDPDKVLKLYLHDYMIKKGMHETAAIFKKEADIGNSPIVIDSPDGFLHEWWSIFYETYSSKQQNNQKNGPESSSKVTQKTEERICIPPIISQLSTTKQRPQQLQINSNFHRMIKQPVACPFPSKVYHRDHLSYLGKDADQRIHPINANKLKFMAGSSSNRMLQDISKLPQKQIFRLQENGGGIRLGRDVPRDPRDIVKRTIQPVDRPCETKASEGFNLVPLNGSWPPLNVGGEIMFQMRQALIQQNQGQQLLSRGEENIKRRTALSSRAHENTLDRANAEEDRPVDENVDSFLSNENENENADNRGVPFSNLKRISATCNTSEGFSFEEVGCLHSSKGKVLSCHFSSDGKVLASAGHEKKVFIWNMETFDCVTTSEAHSLLITDVRFRPGSTIYATSSFDRTVKIWDAAKPNKSLSNLTGHTEQVMSLDFHPRKADILCSCDNNDIIRFWNLNLSVCMHVTKGATKQVRFQPRFGKLLASATGNSINVIDVESNSLLYNLKGHVKDVLSICWEASGNYITSVSEDKACMWSVISGGKCIHELSLNGNKFQSCAFHPGYSSLVVIGGYQSLELWSPSESSKSWSIPAHKGLIAGLAESQQNQMMASASHDHCIKLWK